MEKIKAFLTQKLNKDSFKDKKVIRAIKLTLCGALIFALMIQAFGCFFAPMAAYAAEDYSIVGTWVFNDVLQPYPSTNNVTINVDFSAVKNDGNVQQYNTFFVQYAQQYSYGDTWSFYYRLVNGDSITANVLAYATHTQNWGIGKYITFNNDVDDVTFKTWLKANAVKQGPTSIYDFTGETRIFNDELTLFNTSAATFTESFNFDFEVLGVGTADYIILQRTTDNKYTMSYSFDFDGSGGLTMVYRDSPPFTDGNAEWLGGRVNRKVIKFISNPDDTDFQQWLLDNTTLYTNLDDAYDLGFAAGYNNGYEEGFANSLIGDTLKGPINALSSLTLIEIQGTEITLGGVVMTAIALCLVLAFLKLYAGG